METIGVLGGIASGKSAVAQMFEHLGAVRLDADHAGHLVLEEPEVRQALTARWGAQILTEAGRIDRSAVAHIVFAEGAEGARELQFLEDWTHPRIEARLRAQLADLARDQAPAAVLDAAVMLKAGWDRLCTRLVFVDARRDQRLARALQRGWSEAQFAARERAQSSLGEKRRRAETIIDNSGTLEETLSQVKAVWSTWMVDRD